MTDHPLSIQAFQKHIRDRYYETDRTRGTAATFMWLIEEVGELATALHGDDKTNLEDEFADCRRGGVALHPGEHQRRGSRRGAAEEVPDRRRSPRTQVTPGAAAPATDGIGHDRTPGTKSIELVR
jgi:hypothetical protein